VKKKDNGKIYALKVLRKAFLARRNHLRYAITECNVLRKANSPFIVKLHYAFQVIKMKLSFVRPQNIYTWH
jgi:serum/glucocorticoid-regulated kinase 2